MYVRDCPPPDCPAATRMLATSAGAIDQLIQAKWLAPASLPRNNKPCCRWHGGQRPSVWTLRNCRPLMALSSFYGCRMRSRLKGILELAQRARHYSSQPAAHAPPAFVFDIDGVLIRGRNVLPAALQAMKQLCPSGQWRFPVCFLTNGGGVTEAHKAQQLSTWLQVPVGEHQVVLSHTPMRALAPALGNRPILVAGRGATAAVAAGYGFNKVMTPHQLAAGLPTALPFRHNTPRAPGLSTQEPATPLCSLRDLGWATAAQPLAAVLVMTDPEDWYQDLQLLMDVITGHGDALAKTPAPGSQPIPIYFSNPDLLWANEHPRPRFGQGAFAAALDALHRQVAGSPLPCTTWFGKPNPEPYRLAEQLLLQQARELGLIPQPAAAVPTTTAHSAATRSDNQDSRSHSGGHGGNSAEDSNGRELNSSSTSTSSNTSATTTTTSSSSISSAASPSPGSSKMSTGGSRDPAPACSSSSTAPQLQDPLHTPSPSQVFSAIYAVGDNPAADVRGANTAGPPWVSVLVRTGVFQGPPGSNSGADPAHLVVEDVLAAVQAALHRNRSQIWHSMR